MDVKLLLAVLCVLPLYCNGENYDVMEKGSNDTQLARYKKSDDILPDKEANTSKPHKQAQNHLAAVSKSSIRKRRARVEIDKHGKTVVKRRRRIGRKATTMPQDHTTTQPLLVTTNAPEMFTHVFALEESKMNLTNNERQSRNETGETVQKSKRKVNRRRRLAKKSQRKRKSINLDAVNVTESQQPSTKPKSRPSPNAVDDTPADIIYHLQYPLQKEKENRDEDLNKHRKIRESKHGISHRTHSRKRYPDNGKITGDKVSYRSPRSNTGVQQLISVQTEGKATKEFTREELMGLLLWLGFLEAEGKNKDKI